MRIIVINLESEPARLRAFCERNPHLVDHVEWFPGVDGAKVDRNGLISEGVATPSGLANYSDRQLGCFMSHSIIWRYLSPAVEPQPVMILEDDAVVAHNLERLGLPAADVVRLGYNFTDSVLVDAGYSVAAISLDEVALRSWLAEPVPWEPAPAYFPLLKCFGTPGYTVTPTGAAKLLAQCVPITNKREASDKYGPNLGVDCAMNRTYGKVTTYVAFPPLVVTENRKTW